MSRLVPSLIVAIVLASAGAAVAGDGGQEGARPGSMHAQQAQAQPSTVPGGAALERGREAAGAAAERVRSNVPLTPELEALRDELAGQVEELRTIVHKTYEEAGAKAVAYALWGAAGLFAIMVLSSVLGGVIVALIFRRRG
jgi:hypothetical protein